MNLYMSSQSPKGMRVVSLRIIWRYLKVVKTVKFKKMLEGYFRAEEDAQIWTNMTNSIKNVATRTLGVTSLDHEESW